MDYDGAYDMTGTNAKLKTAMTVHFVEGNTCQHHHYNLSYFVFQSHVNTEVASFCTLWFCIVGFDIRQEWNWRIQRHCYTEGSIMVICRCYEAHKWNTFIWCCVICAECDWFSWWPEQLPVWRWGAGGCWGLSGELCFCAPGGCHKRWLGAGVLSAWELPVDWLNDLPTGRKEWGQPRQQVTESKEKKTS